METKPDVRVYKIRADVFFVPAHDGVWLRNNQGSFSIKGSSSYRLIRFLFAKLDGSRTIDAICADLDPKQRRAIEGLLDTLEQRGFVKQVVRPPEAIPSWAEQLYGDQLHLIEHYVETPFRNFMRFRDQRLRVVGHGTTLRATLVALIEAGAGHVVVRPTAATADERVVLARIVEAANTRDRLLHLQIAWACPTIETATQDLPPTEHADAVLFAADAGSTVDVGRLCWATMQDGGVFAAVVPVGDRLVVSPLFRRETGACWECLYRSIAIPDAPAVDTSPAAAAVAAQQMVHRLFCSGTGIAWESGPTCTIVDCQTLSASAHRVSRHPLCSLYTTPITTSVSTIAPPDQPLRPDLPNSDDPPEIIHLQDAIVAHIGAWTDRLVGPLLSVGEDSLGQIPLSASRCVIPALHSQPGALASHTIICRGLSARETRNQAALLALEWLARELIGRNAALEQRAGPVGSDVVRAAQGAVGQPSAAVGAGWSASEALYRGLVALSLDWAASLNDSSWGQTLRVAQLRATRIGAYVLGTLCDQLPAEPDIAVGRAPTGMFVAAARLDDGVRCCGAGVTAVQAGLNALLDLASCGLDRDEQAPHEVRPAHLLLEPGTWAEVLGRTEAHRYDWGRHLSFREIGSLLPFTVGHAYITAIQLTEG